MVGRTENIKKRVFLFLSLGLHGQEYNVLFNFMRGRNELKALGYSKNKTSDGFQRACLWFEFRIVYLLSSGFYRHSVQRELVDPEEYVISIFRVAG